MVHIYLIQLALPEGVLPRCDHSTVAVDLAPGLTEVTVFAGCLQYDPRKTLSDDVKLAETVILSFGMLPMKLLKTGYSFVLAILRHSYHYCPHLKKIFYIPS